MSATIRKRKGRHGDVTFTAQVRVKGFKSTAKTFDTRADAKTWARTMDGELINQSKRGGIREYATHLTIHGLIDECLRDDETKAMKSFASFQPLCEWWQSELGTKKVMEFGVPILRKARDDLRYGTTKRSSSTVNRYLSAMRSVWNWGRAAGLIASDHGWPTRLMLTEPKGRVRYLSDDELANLLKIADPSPVMHSAILFSIATGMRQGEMLRLTWADVDFDKARVTVRVTKNGDVRVVHLTPTAIAALKRVKALPVASIKHVFVDGNASPFEKMNFQHRWVRLRTRANLENFRWHDLRHTCASFLAQSGSNLFEIGSVLGHKSTSVTMRYAHLVSGAPVTGHDKLDAKLKSAQIFVQVIASAVPSNMDLKSATAT